MEVENELHPVTEVAREWTHRAPGPLRGSTAVTVSRALWHRLETIHAVTYFSAESVAAARELGLKGFWMGYFGFRASPMGAVSAATVEATFGNFAPRMVERAIPDVWHYADPDDLARSRVIAAADALRRLTPGVEVCAVDANLLLERTVAAAAPLGRPLFAANAAMILLDDPVMRLWQLATTTREHRGDGHIQVLAAAGLDGCEAHLLHAAEFSTPHEVLKDNRGWSDEEWARAIKRLNARRLLDQHVLTAAGRSLRKEIEADTDRLAAQPIDVALDADEQRHLLDVLTRPAREIADSGAIPYPNPIGLQRFEG